jgi:hypothetical protein
MPAAKATATAAAPAHKKTVTVAAKAPATVAVKAPPPAVKAPAAQDAPDASVGPTGSATVSKTAKIRFTTKTVKDPTLAKGKSRIVTPGVLGVERLIFDVTLVGGKETSRRLVSREVITPPVTQVKALGTKVDATAPAGAGCDPNYAGACVPIASDVDCAGGSGNGPAYVKGPVTVIGSDIYGLDRDKDGIGCE